MSEGYFRHTNTPISQKVLNSEVLLYDIGVLTLKYGYLQQFQ